MPYQSPYSATLADLMFAGQRARMRAKQQAQQAEAEARMAGAQAWGGFGQNMAGLLGPLLQAYLQQPQKPTPTVPVSTPSYIQGGVQAKYLPTK